MKGEKSDQPDQASNLFGRRAAYLAMLMASPVILLYTYLGKFREGIGAWICAGILVGIVRIRWDLRKNPWFWVAMLMAALLQVPFVMFVPWTQKYSTMVTLLPFGILDFVIITWCIKQAEKIAKRKSVPPSG